MLFSITTAFILLVVVVAFLFIARRVFRLALKLAFVAVVVFLLIAGSAIGWWRGWFSSFSSQERSTPQSNRRTNSNRRPSR